MEMPPSQYVLRSPASECDWDAYHAIRRAVLFEARGHVGTYDPHHPDDRRPGNHPKLLLFAGEPVGVLRIDIVQPRAIFRRVAVREEAQRRGHGRAMLRLAEDFAREQGCSTIVSFVDPGAVEFYRKCGFATETPAGQGDASVLMAKVI